MLAKVRVHTDRTIGRVDPNLYGHFIEHLGRCIYGGLWAEMLNGRKFAGPDLYEFGVISPWESVGKGPGVFFNHDNTNFYTGNQSQKIVVREDDGRPHGISQGHLALECGRRYHLRLVVRQVGLTGPLRFALENDEGQTYVAQECECREGDWHVHEATLRQRFHFRDEFWTDAMIWTLFAEDYPDSPATRYPIEAFDAAGRKIL